MAGHRVMKAQRNRRVRALFEAGRNHGHLHGVRELGVGDNTEDDLVLLDADPLLKVSNTRAIAGVILRGRWLPRQELRGMLEAEATFYEDNPDFNPFAPLSAGTTP